MQLESSVTHRKQTIRQFPIDTKLARTARLSLRGNYRSRRIHRVAANLASRIITHQSRITPFAHAPNLCETRAMRKLPNIAICVLATTFIFAGTAAAQQTPATNPSSTPAAANAPAASDSSAPAAKKPAKPAAKPAAAAAKPTGSAQSSAPTKTQTGT